MLIENSIHLSLALPPRWWRRLQRVSRTCYASPGDFVREAVEAEIVRRELLLGDEENYQPDWSIIAVDIPSHPRLQ